MCDLAAIVNLNASQVFDQGYHVNLDWKNVTVHIVRNNEPYDIMFLNFEWADVFLSRVNDLKAQLPNFDESILAASVAKLYLEP